MLLISNLGGCCDDCWPDSDDRIFCKIMKLSWVSTQCYPSYRSIVIPYAMKGCHQHQINIFGHQLSYIFLFQLFYLSSLSYFSLSLFIFLTFFPPFYIFSDLSRPYLILYLITRQLPIFRFWFCKRCATYWNFIWKSKWEAKWLLKYEWR